MCSVLNEHKNLYLDMVRFCQVYDWLGHWLVRKRITVEHVAVIHCNIWHCDQSLREPDILVCSIGLWLAMIRYSNEN